MNRMEVRCCCQATKVLGTLPVQASDSAEGSLRLYPVGLPSSLYQPDAKPAKNPETIDFRVSRWFEDDGRGFHTGLALKHENVTIETLRRIPGFEEASS